MKKLLSVIVTLAMLISCIAPSLVSFAADEPALVAADVSFDPAVVARGNAVDATVSITNNPGISYAVLYIYYDNTQLEIADGAISSLVGDDYSLVTAYNLNSTDRANKRVFDAAGITTGANIKFATVTLEGGSDTTAEELVNIEFDVVADAAEGDVFTYGVFAAEAIENVNYDAVVAQYSADTATLTAAADPNAPVYEDKHFDDVTIYADTVTVNKGTTTVEVGFAIDGHGEMIDAYGMNSVLFRIVYPKELKLVSSRLGEVYETSDGIDLDSVKNFADEAYTPSKEVKGECDWSGYAWEGSDDYIVTAMFDDDDPYYQNKNRGYLAYATFEVPAEAGTYDIKVISGPENLFASVYETTSDVPSPELIPFAVADGAIKVVVGDCDHAAEYLVETGVASTCTVAGWKKVECTNCGEVVSEETLALADHQPGDKVVTKAPTTEEEGAYEIACTVCGTVVESGTIPAIDDIYFTIGNGSAKYGDEVVLPITVTNNKSGMFIAALDVTFDSSKLTFKGYEGGDIVAADYVSATQYEDGVVRAYFENNDELANIVGDGVIIYLVFEVAYDEALVGTEIEVAVSAEADNVINAEGVALATVFENGTVKVEAREATITVGNAQAPFGKEALVPVTIKNNPGIFIGIFEVSYDASVLEYVGFEASTEVFNNVDYIYATKTEDGKVTLYFENGDDANATANGLLGNLKFKVADDADLVGSSFEVAIASNADDVLNYEGNNADHVLENGSVTVADRAKVEVQNGEGKYGKHALVPVAVVNNEGFFIGSFDVKYDASALTFLGYEDLFNENCYVTKVADGEIRIYVEAVENADIVADIVIAELAFAIADNEALVGAELPVTIEAVDMINYAGEDLDYAMIDGAVKVLDREKIEVSDAEGEEAHEVKVPVSVSNNVGIWGAIIEYTFDDSVLEFVGVESGLFETVAGESYSVNGNVITVFVENADVNADVVADGVLYTLVFKAVAEGTATVDAAIVEIINANGEDVVDFVANAGEVVAVACDHSEESITASVTKEPTADEEGVTTYTCDICGNVVKTEAIAKLAKIVIGTADIAAGDKVSIPVELVDNKGVWSIGLEIAYDATALEFVGLESGLFTVSADNASANDGIITIFVDADDLADVTADGVAFNLVFNTATSANGVYTLDAALIAENTINANGDSVDYVVRGNEIVVIGHTIIHFDAVEPGCHYNGNIEYWFCSDCEAFWADEALTQLTNSKNIIIPATGSENVVHFEAVEPGCHYDGNIEYWVCYDCEQVWADEALTQLTNIKNVVLPATGSENLVHFDAVEPGCHYNGNIEYWFCADCQQFWADEALTQLTNAKNVVLPATGEGNLVHFDAVEPGCHYDGNIEYWVCYDCEQVWTDEALTQLTNIKNVVVPATGSENLQHVEAVAPTCYTEGNIEYWYCPDCEQFWADEALTQITNAKSVILPATHSNLVHFDAVEAGCHYNGNVEYWVCYDCETFWTDAALTQITNAKNVIIPATGEGNLVHFEAVEPGCHYDGNIEYWVCYDCEQVWADEALTQLTNIKNVVVPATGSENLQHVEAVAPTCYTEGNIEYWYCPDCEQYWADEALTQLTNAKNVIIGATHSNLVHFDAVEPGCHYDGNIEYWVCYDCETFWQDELLREVTNAKNVVLPAIGSENVQHVEAKAPTCYEEGNIEYWYCPDCEQFWQDEALTQLTNAKNVLIGAAHTNVVHFNAVEPGCHYNGNIEYWVCYDCETFWQDEALTQITNYKNVIVPATGSENLQHVEAVAATCFSEGNIEYWYCPDCEQYWQDEALTQITNAKNVILPTIAHANLVHFDAVAPGCHYNGNIEYWYCPDCETFWQDEALTQITNSKNVIVPATGSENLQHVEAKAPTCYEEGNIEYWYCPDCEQFWQDEALTQLTNAKNVLIGATHSNLVHFDAVEPGCHYNGNIEYWVCYDCETFWQDELLREVTNAKNVILPATGSENLQHVEAKAPTCYENGNIEYWYCPDCEQFWQDEALTQLTNAMNVIVPATHGNFDYFDAVEPGCHYNGNIEYWVCYDCETFWTDEFLTQITNSKNVILPATGSENLQHVEAVAPTCYTEGNIEYWYCPDCEQFWQDEALTQLTNSKNVIVPATHGNLVHFDAVEPGCHYNGNIEYWVCYDCETFWTDAALTQITNSKNVVLPATGSENLQHVEAKAPTCYEEGNIEYWYCPDCEQFWQDEALTQLTNSKNVIVPAAHGNLVHFDAVEAGCHYNGNIEYWVCYDCETFWTDEALTQITNSKNVIVPATGEGNLVHFDAVEPGCHYDGNIEYWVCYDCEQVWTDEALTQLTNIKNVVLPATGSEDVVHFEAVEPGCHYNGNIEYWFCAECQQFWTDEALTQVTNAKNVVLPATGSENLQHVEAVAPTCHTEGNIEYWYCPDCEQFWVDPALTQITNSKSVILPATEEHVWADDFTIDKEAANGEDGEMSKHCTVEGCPARTEITVIPGHIVIVGDVDEDGAVTASDITAVIKHMKGIAEYRYADVDGDGAVTASDITAVIKIMKGNN